jgi:hypothetical protein
MLVDRPGAGASWTVRTLIWAAGVVGIGLIVLAVQQLLAEPAGAETPDLVDGAVGTVEQVVDPASAALDDTSADATASPAPEPLPSGVTAEPVVDLAVEPPATQPPEHALAPEAPAETPASLAPVAESLVPVAEPLASTVEAAGPVVDVAAPAVEDAAAPVVEAVPPVPEAAAPVVEAVAPVVASVVEAAPPLPPPVAESLAPLVTPVVEAVPVVDQVLSPVVGAVAGPPTDLSGVASSSPAGVGRPDDPPAGRSRAIGARAAPPRVLSGTNASIPALASIRRTATGEGEGADGVPTGPLPLAAPPAVPGGMSGPASGGGAGTSVLLAILAGGVAWLGRARGGVVHDRAARLIGLVHGPGCLPG